MTLFEKVTQNPKELALYIANVTQECSLSPGLRRCQRCPFQGHCFITEIYEKLNSEVEE